MNPWLRRTILTALTLMLLSLGVIYGLMSYYHHEISQVYEDERAVLVQRLDAHTETFITDQERLSSKTWAVDGPCRRDAGPSLNAGVPWQRDAQGDVAAQKAALTDWDAIRAAWDPFEKSLDKDSPWWRTPKSTLDASTLDLSWMSRLSEYDCWDLDRSGPREALTPKTFNELILLPSPNYSPLLKAGKLRIIQGVQQGEAGKAIKEVHDLGRLLLTTEDTIGVTIGELMIISASKAVSDLEREGVGLSEVPRWDDEDIAALERMSPFTWTAYLRLMTPARHRGTIELDFNDAPGVQAYGRCAGVNESLRTAIILRGMLDEEAFLWMDGVLERSPCRLDMLRRIWDEPGVRLENDSRAFCQADVETAEDCPYPSPRWLPSMLKESLGMVLGSIAQPNAFSGYADP